MDDDDGRCDCDGRRRWTMDEMNYFIMDTNKISGKRAMARMLAVIVLAIPSRILSQAFNLESPAKCRVNNHVIRTSSFASPPSSSTITIASKSATTFISYRPHYYKRRRKTTNILPIIHAVMNAEEDGYHRTIPSAHSNHTTIYRRANRNEQLFQKRLTELQDFRLNHGHGSIPTPYHSNPSLGIWAANVRRQYSLWSHAEDRGVPYVGYLTPSRRQQLQLAGFDFTSLTERQFHTRLKELKTFKEQYGHCMVPEKWDDNVALGAWVSNIRSLYKKRMTLRHQRQIQLQHDEEEMSAQSSDTSISKTGNQKQRGGRRRLLKSSFHNLRKKRQRLPRFSHLDEHRIQLLEEMGFVWSSIDRKWLEMLEWAKVYGVVNHVMKLHVAEEVIGGENVERNRPEHSIIQNRTLLLHNYHQFVQNIQNQSLLPSFHPQDRILALLSEETFVKSSLEQQPLLQPISSSPSPDGNIIDDSTAPSLDYRIRRNDALHYPLRIWMINQRSNYNRLDHATNQTREKSPLLITPASTLTAQRLRALEAINFPWSGRFRSRVDELQREQEVTDSMERHRERERRKEQKEREEKERVEQLLLVSSSAALVSYGDNNNLRADLAEAEADIMTLWGEEEDDDDDDW